jgi:CheY-like chemotaxis protein
MNSRILVVDDDETIRHLVVNILERAGFDTVEAFDGQDAIEHLDHDDVDGVVLDLMMPRVDGFGVVDHLAATRPEMVKKTVMLTAYPQRAVRERVHHLCRVLAKPFGVRDVVAAVEQCVGEHGRRS